MQTSIPRTSLRVLTTFVGLSLLLFSVGCSKPASRAQGSTDAKVATTVTPAPSEGEPSSTEPKLSAEEELKELNLELAAVHNLNIIRYGLMPTNKALIPEIRASLGNAVKELSFLKKAFGPGESTYCQRFLNVYENLNLEILKAFDKGQSALPNDKVTALIVRSRIRSAHLFLVQLNLLVLNNHDGGVWQLPEPYYCKLGNRQQFQSLVAKISGPKGLTAQLIRQVYGIQGYLAAHEEQVELQNYVASITEWEQRKSIFVNTMEMGLSVIASGYLAGAAAASKGVGVIGALGRAMGRVLGLKFAVFTTLSAVDVMGWNYLNHWLIPTDEFTDYQKYEAATENHDYQCGQTENFLKLNFDSPAAYADILQRIYLEPWKTSQRLMIEKHKGLYREYVKKYGSIQKALDALKEKGIELAKKLPEESKPVKRLKSIAKQSQDT